MYGMYTGTYLYVGCGLICLYLSWVWICMLTFLTGAPNTPLRAPTGVCAACPPCGEVGSAMMGGDGRQQEAEGKRGRGLPGINGDGNDDLEEGVQRSETPRVVDWEMPAVNDEQHMDSGDTEDEATQDEDLWRKCDKARIIPLRISITL